MVSVARARSARRALRGVSPAFSQGSSPAIAITHVITGLGTGGTEMTLLSLVSRFDPKRFRSRVVSLADQGTIGPLLEARGVAVAALGAWPVTRSLAGLWRLARLLRHDRPALIQGWMSHGNVAATAGAWLAGLQCPVVWNVRQSLADLSLERWYTAVLIRLGARWSNRATRIIYNSQVSAQQHLAIGYSAQRAVIIPNGFDLDRFRPSTTARAQVRRMLGLGEEALVIGHVARYHPMKGHATLLVAASLARNHNTPAHFVLIGHGVDSRNAAVVSMRGQLGLGERVHLLGERADVPDLMPAFDIAVSASTRNEGVPNAVGEAMSCGVPCVVTDVGDSAMLVGDCGVVVPPGDSAALAKGLEQLIALTSSARRELGERARRRVADHFSLGHAVAQYERLYEEVLTRASSQVSR